MFSVVIPLYNKELSITNTIQSVLDQTFQDFEIVVVNDGSTDRSADIVEQMKDSRIRLIHQENQGVSAARNTGIREAKYEWIAFLDGDDLWEKNHLEEIVKMMGIYPHEKVYATSYKYSDNRVMFKHERETNIFKIENYFKEALNESLICSINIVIHKSCFDKVGWFNESISRGEDLDMWNRLAGEYQIIKSSKVTAIYRVEAENRSYQASPSLERFYTNFEFSQMENYEKKYYLNLATSYLKEFLKNKEYGKAVRLLVKSRTHSLTLISNLIVNI